MLANAFMTNSLAFLSSSLLLLVVLQSVCGQLHTRTNDLEFFRDLFASNAGLDDRIARDIGTTVEQFRQNPCSFAREQREAEEEDDGAKGRRADKCAGPQHSREDVLTFGFPRPTTQKAAA